MMAMSPHLTKRERQVLQGCAYGMTNRQIGKSLIIGESTVKTHMRRLLKKLGLNSRYAAMAYYAVKYIDEAARETWYRGPVATAFVEGYQRLTPSERKVFDVLIAEPGITDREIGARLFLVEDTVKTHMRRIGAKCGLRGTGKRGRLVVYYLVIHGQAQSSSATTAAPAEAVA